jgi:hypothetical protein
MLTLDLVSSRSECIEYTCTIVLRATPFPAFIGTAMSAARASRCPFAPCEPPCPFVPCECFIPKIRPCLRPIRRAHPDKDSAIVCPIGHRVHFYCIELWVNRKDQDMRNMTLPCGCLTIGVLGSGIWDDVLAKLGYEIRRLRGRVIVRKKTELRATKQLPFFAFM